MFDINRDYYTMPVDMCVTLVINECLNVLFYVIWLRRDGHEIGGCLCVSVCARMLATGFHLHIPLLVFSQPLHDLLLELLIGSDLVHGERTAVERVCLITTGKKDELKKTEKRTSNVTLYVNDCVGCKQNVVTHLSKCRAIVERSTVTLEEGSSTGSSIRVDMMGSKNSSGASE